MALDLWHRTFPGLGVAGAAWATVISYTIGAVMLCTKLFTGRCVLHISISRIIRVHFESVKRIIRISVPAAIDAFLTQIGFLFFAKIVAILGTVPLAAHQIAYGLNRYPLCLALPWPFQQPHWLVKSLGAKNVNLALLSMRRSCYFAMALMGFFAFIFLIFPGQMAMIF